MKHIKVFVASIKKLKDDVYLLSFKSAYLAAHARPGQFLHIKINSADTILRRPFSIHKVERGQVKLLFRIRGKGTAALARYKHADPLDVIGPLGNGFRMPRNTAGVENILVAGGMGVAPLLFLAQKIKSPTRVVLLGVQAKGDLVCVQEFKKSGFRVLTCSEDGSSGHKGLAPDLLRTYLEKRNSPSGASVYTCGPEAMFQEIASVLKSFPAIKCQVSFEQFMGCGIGLCQACMIKTKQGFKRVCKDGPVFNIHEVF